jgi:pimeloyl-ACP methyl ester carboxylesterase
MRRIALLIMLVMLLPLTLGAVVAQENLCQVALEVMITDDGVEYVHTPDTCFENLPDWPYEAQYVEIDGLRQAYVDVGSGESGETILLLHGQPTWSYLYRKMIPVLAAEGHRVITMDHVGFGRSDKPIDPDYYTFLGHTDRLAAFIQELELEQGSLNIFVQDWGSLIGLYVVGTNPDWFDRVIVGNGYLPTYEEGTVPYDLPENPLVTRQLFFTTITSIPEQQPEFYDAEGNVINPQMRNDNFGIWIDYARNDERFVASQLVEAMTYFDLTDEELAAYDAPFPSRIAMGGPRAFPGLVNQLPGVTGIAWAGLGEFEKPFLTIWGGNDPSNLGRPETQQALLDHVPGTAGWDHVRLPEASHFLQDDQGEEIARRINDFIAQTTPDEEVSLLEYHNGYWVTEMENPELPVPLTMINDMHVDPATNSVTVYAQARLLRQVVAPPQVGPGECTETPMGDTACFHPDAVYLNGSGEELMEADGTGSWWVKHAWILGGEGYMNCELRAQEEYNDCVYAEGVLLEDGLSMQVGAVGEGMEAFFNIRTPLLDEDPILYRVTRYEPANLGAEADEIDLTPTAQWELIWRCEEVPSPLDNQVRSCPTINN